jgi:hypothetical protein
MSFARSGGLDPDAPVPYLPTKKALTVLGASRRGQQLARREPGVCRICGNFGSGDAKNPCVCGRTGTRS